MAQTDYHTSCA